VVCRRQFLPVLFSILCVGCAGAPRGNSPGNQDSNSCRCLGVSGWIRGLFLRDRLCPSVVGRDQIHCGVTRRSWLMGCLCRSVVDNLMNARMVGDPIGPSYGALQARDVRPVWCCTVDSDCEAPDSGPRLAVFCGMSRYAGCVQRAITEVCVTS